MDEILQLLASSDVATRISVAEDLNRRLLDRTAWIDPLSADTKKRLFNSVAGLARESNMKLCVAGLTCLQTMVELHADEFQTYMHVTFDTVVAKFADVKVSGRAIPEPVLSLSLSLSFVLRCLFSSRLCGQKQSTYSSRSSTRWASPAASRNSRCVVHLVPSPSPSRSARLRV